jgi:hypothetical protein
VEERNRLLGATAILGIHFDTEQGRKVILANRPQFGSLTKESSDTYVLRSGDTAQWMMPVKSVTGVKADGGKTLQCIREKLSLEK